MDIELSFIDKDGVLSLVEELLVHSWPEDLGKLSLPFPRITYQEAMDSYGSDKPDITFENKVNHIIHIYVCVYGILKAQSRVMSNLFYYETTVYL